MAQKRSMLRHFGIEAMALIQGRWVLMRNPAVRAIIVDEGDIISIESKQYADVVLSEKDGWKPKTGMKTHVHFLSGSRQMSDRIRVSSEDTNERFLQKFPALECNCNKLKGGTRL